MATWGAMYTFVISDTDWSDQGSIICSGSGTSGSSSNSGKQRRQFESSFGSCYGGELSLCDCSGAWCIRPADRLTFAYSAARLGQSHGYNPNGEWASHSISEVRCV